MTIRYQNLEEEMKSSFALFAVALLVVTSVTGAQVYAPTNTPTTGSANAFPWGFSTSARFQEIIPALYLPSAPFKITDIAFAPTTSANFTAKRLRVRMCHTTLPNFKGKTSFDKNMCPCPTTMFNGTGSWAATANTWSPVGLDCSFGYDGKRNLLIEICFDGRTAGPACHRDSVLPRLWDFGSTNPCQVPTGATDGGTTEAGQKVCLTIDRQCVLNASDTVSIGGTLGTQVFTAPAGDFYQIAASFSDTTKIDLGTCSICLTPDSLFWASLLVGPPVFSGYSGVIGSGGTFGSKLAIPKFQQLIGACLYHAAIVYNKTGITRCTNSAGTQITL